MNNKTGIRTLIEILLVSTRLGLTSFGGPAAHLGYFREEYVKKRKWLDEKSYADLIALCQFLPGPASSQVGISIGIVRGGIAGGIVSWFGFTMPSVIALILFAYFLLGTDVVDSGWIHGLKLVAVAVVAHAVIGMGQKLTPDRQRITLALLAAVLTLLFPTAIGQILIIIGAGIAGYLLYRKAKVIPVPDLPVRISKKAGAAAWILFFGLLAGLPILRALFPGFYLSLFDTFYRVGAIVFGGGHVVLPMIEREVVPTGWISEEVFLAGYGAAQAVPGPLFTFSGYLGAAIEGWEAAIIAVVAMFLPSFLLVIGALPFWNAIRRKPAVQAALMGVNAAVVGILLAALYDPVFTSSVLEPIDFAVVLISFGILYFWKVPAWAVVIITAILGYAVSFL
ncbi:chromate efflux transporter [Bacillus sp. AK031]